MTTAPRNRVEESTLHNFTADLSCSKMPGKRTNKQYHTQGWNAALLGHSIDECPYLATSTAETHWKRGFRTVK